MEKKFYLTTAIPYVNAKPHLGHTFEWIIADVINRYERKKGKDVFIASGADENALKNVIAAKKAGKNIKDFLDENSKKFFELYKMLDINLDAFRRGSDKKRHWPGVRKLWQLVKKNGDLYKKKYKGMYCVSCEAFKTEKDLVNGFCPDHKRKPIYVEEENYFFRLKRYEKTLYKLIKGDRIVIFPKERKKEILSFIKGGLEDFSVSRDEKRAMGVGIPVPSDPTQKIYVWFDALCIYMTAVGFGTNQKLWKKYWPANLHIIGKDIIRFHAVYWPAILLSAKLPLPKKILVHGFITSKGQKMSKTVGNVIDPYEIMQKFGKEALRYILLSQIPTQKDGDLTHEKIKKTYNADLANGLGNLVSRIQGLVKKKDLKKDKEPKKFSPLVEKYIKRYELEKAIKEIWRRIKRTDNFITKKRLWEKINEKEKRYLLTNIRQIAFDLEPFLPETSQKIKKAFSEKGSKKRLILFPKI